MSLLDLWRTSPYEIQTKQVDQIIAFAGSGRLLDDGPTSMEFRELLKEIDDDLLARFADECLSKKFDNSGLALQDIVNQIGARLGFNIADGRYRGLPGHIGNDGLWSAQGHSIIVEVKTTDAYRVGLKTIADYRIALVEQGRAALEKSSILIVVGRQDTGELEEQVRGSRYAWDTRIVSVDSLVRLLKLIKERIDDPGLVQRIRSVLIPHEFTRLDEIIEVIFSTAEDARTEQLEPSEAPGTDADTLASAPLPADVKEACVERVETHLELRLARWSRTIYIDQSRESSVVCLVSKEHVRVTPFFWFGFHPYHKAMLEETLGAHVALGCGSAQRLLLIPYGTFVQWLEGMNMTTNPERSYWHVQILRRNNRLELHQKDGQAAIDVTNYLIPELAGPAARKAALS